MQGYAAERDQLFLTLKHTTRIKKIKPASGEGSQKQISCKTDSTGKKRSTLK